MANNAAVYIELAEAYHAKGRYQERDRFLILAADSAWSAGAIDEAERLRSRILEYNPNHLLRPYPSFDEALKSADIQAYVQQLRRGYPRERAVELLKELLGDAGHGDLEETLAADHPVFKLAAPPPPKFELPGKGEVPPAVRPKPAEAPKPEPRLAPKKTAPSETPIPVSRQMIVEKPVKRPAPPAPRPTPATSPEDFGGAWVGTLLFIILLVMMLVTLLHVFVQPFYPIFPP